MKRVLVVLAMLASGAVQAQPTDVPIIVGKEAELDACTANGQIVGLDPKGDGFLSVRSGPGGKPYREIARVY